MQGMLTSKIQDTSGKYKDVRGKFVIFSSLFSGDGADTAVQCWACGNKTTASSFYIPPFSSE